MIGTDRGNRNLFMPSWIEHRVIEREAIAPMPINEMVLTVAVMTFAFLGEVAVFALLGIF